MAIVSILMIGCFNDCDLIPIIALERMCALLRKWFNVFLTPQSLQEIINRKEASEFIKKIMTCIMKNEAEKVIKKLLKNRQMRLKLISRILIQDSTVISLPDTLKKLFKGFGGSASKAAIKFDFIIDQNNKCILKIKYFAGRIPDLKLCNDIMEVVQEEDLIIRDLGYFNLSQFSKITMKKAYFISRLSNSVNVYLNKNDQIPVDIIEHLKKLDVKNKDADIQVYLGQKERIPVRLIGITVPPEVVEARRQQYKRSNGRSKEPSEFLNTWNGYTIMITNVPKEQLSLKMILKLYKVRWQIELFFKNMKSNMGFDNLTGRNKYRILCLIYIKLAVTWMISILYAYAQAIVEEKKEVSLCKLTRWLIDIGEFRTACLSWNFLNLLEELERDIDLLCMQKRKRRTSWRDIEETYEDEEIGSKTA